MFHADGQGQAFLEFENVVRFLEPRGETLRFAMNGGMYHTDRAPVGLYVEDGVQDVAINLNPGPGNFHMLPNGVFWTGLTEERGVRAHIDESSVWPSARGEVGVDESGVVYFVKSETRVNFHDFATLFRDHLNTPDALYLDGTVSRLYIDGERNDKGYPMGPIIGVVEE
jgi:uncharacterized protein YigE (DUF2233 family)